MDSLWKKESNNVYIDIFKFVDKHSVVNQMMKLLTLAENQKNNDTSTRLRQKGNSMVATKHWGTAMGFYNESLRFAELGSVNVSLAYANRSLCFLKMKMFEKCLVDIEMAIKANYPKEEMAKLEERRKYCMKQINGGNLVENGAPNLDFDADENFPGLANVLEMKWNEKYGRHYIAKCDIDVGKTIIVEEAYVTTSEMKEYCNVCDTCCKKLNNFIACTNCTKALFCNEVCADDNMHKIICHRVSCHNKEYVEFIVRSILQAKSIFSTVNELMTFVGDVTSQKLKVPLTIVDMKSKYQFFLKLNLHLGDVDPGLITNWGQQAFEILMDSPKIKAWFVTQNQIRFLMHLCVMHSYIIQRNVFGYRSTSGIFLLMNNFNHSCAPNVLRCTHENKTIAITSRPVKKGDQLFIWYDASRYNMPIKERQQELMNDFGFKCDCEKCESSQWPISISIIRSDDNFQHFLKELQDANFDVNNINKCSSLGQKCLDILIKYSDISTWCIEFEILSIWYGTLSG